jgi:hypothetical protein
MPTYTNIGTSDKLVTSFSGAAVTLAPDAQQETRFFYDDPDLRLDSDTPVWTQVAAWDVVDLDDVAAEYDPDDGFAGAMVAIDPDAVGYFLMKISDEGSVTVRRQVSDNDDYIDLKDWNADLPVIEMPARRTVEKIYLSGTGTVTIVQYRSPLA